MPPLPQIAQRGAESKSESAHKHPLHLLASLLSPAPVPALSQLPGTFWLTYMKLDSYDPHYRHQAGGVFTATTGPTWQCDPATSDAGIWPDRDDVSGDRAGMRCDPGDDVGFPLYRDPLEVVDFNTGRFWAGHQSMCKMSF
ncbi:hypothetical protein F5B18DRAFT_646302 [Nemania serpens]|nr:hypothetical protein F5B18DRAFT_646302 [Nemania serpens]